MGRKIPARKHHGVRDPLKQAADRYNLIKDKINHPPEKQDFQKVSHNLANFIRLKDEAKSGKPPKRRRPADGDDGADRPENYKSNSARNPRHTGPNGAAGAPTHRHDKQLGDIHRLQNEPDVDYLRRVNRITQASIKETQFEAKYGVEVVRNTKTGEIKIKKRPADQLDEEMKAALKARKRGEVDDEGNATAKKKRQNQAEKPMSKDERRRLVKEMMAKKREDKAAAAAKCVEYKQDVVAFGEVTHGPPTLVTPRRAQKAETVARPGNKKSLLLHSVLDPQQADESADDDNDNADGAGEPRPKKAKKTTVDPKKPVDLKGKRKELPAATRQMIEKQQQSVMDMYRQLKKTNRLNNIETST